MKTQRAVCKQTFKSIQKLNACTTSTSQCMMGLSLYVSAVFVCECQGFVFHI